MKGTNKKVIDETIGFDYTNLIYDQKYGTQCVTQEEIDAEENELVKEFLNCNKDVKPYIDKALFDPQALVARYIISCCKDKNYEVKVGENNYRLPLAIMIKAMGDCYNYIVDVAKKLAEARGDSSKIQLSDDAVMLIAENYFKLGGRKADIKVIDPNKKEKKSSGHVPGNPEGEKNVEPTPEPAKEENKQLSFFEI